MRVLFDVLGDATHLLPVRHVEPSADNNSEGSAIILEQFGDECADRVVDNGRNAHLHSPLLELNRQQVTHILANHALGVEALRPTHQHSRVERFLLHGEGESEPQRRVSHGRSLDEVLDALRDEPEQALSVASDDVLHGDLEFRGLRFHHLRIFEGKLENTEVGAPQVKGVVLSRLSLHIFPDDVAREHENRRPLLALQALVHLGMQVVHHHLHLVRRQVELAAHLAKGDGKAVASGRGSGELGAGVWAQMANDLLEALHVRSRCDGNVRANSRE
mmetsp:Transcript_15699/g.31926  ORF Transcript_15699/g.31926 Transcript_15699/m.31926 type:complete len:275 (+) Transcript_15699:932-1756(+)